MISSLASARISDASHGPVFASGQPRVIVLHSTESPLAVGGSTAVARFLARRRDASVHAIIGTRKIIAAVDERYIAWGAGTVNSAALQIEQTGYARYTRSKWLSKRGRSMLHLVAELVADWCERYDIPARWLTDDELRDAWLGRGPGGLTTHDQCRRVIGGTTHHDPGPGYPGDYLLSAVEAVMKMDLSDATIDRIAYRVWAYKNPDAGDDMDMHGYLVRGARDTRTLLSRIKSRVLDWDTGILKFAQLMRGDAHHPDSIKAVREQTESNSRALARIESEVTK